MVQLKSPREVETMAAGGKILAATHQVVRGAVRAGATTMDLDKIAEQFIRSHEGATPSFKGLYGFPATICASINEEVVHGIPSVKRVLKEGDIISVDIGVFYGGMHTDAANTWAVGPVDEKTAKLLRVTKQALDAGLAAAVVGNHVGDIGNAIETVVLKGGFAVVRELVGHGVGQMMHEEPQVPNHGKAKRGMKLVHGLTLAIEPMVNAGSANTRTLGDKWTVITVDGSRSAHFEHTIAVLNEGSRVLTR